MRDTWLMVLTRKWREKCIELIEWSDDFVYTLMESSIYFVDVAFRVGRDGSKANVFWK